MPKNLNPHPPPEAIERERAALERELVCTERQIDQWLMGNAPDRQYRADRLRDRARGIQARLRELASIDAIREHLAADPYYPMRLFDVMLRYAEARIAARRHSAAAWEAVTMYRFLNWLCRAFARLEWPDPERLTAEEWELLRRLARAGSGGAGAAAGEDYQDLCG